MPFHVLKAERFNVSADSIQALNAPNRHSNMLWKKDAVIAHWYHRCGDSIFRKVEFDNSIAHRSSAILVEASLDHNDKAFVI